jgi:hypothetical protein
VYAHPKCGVGTKMPEEIVRSYLVNPFLSGSGSFCCGCGDYVPEEELFWTETGQNVAEYQRELQEGYLREHGEPPPSGGGARTGVRVRLCPSPSPNGGTRNPSRELKTKFCGGGGSR